MNTTIRHSRRAALRLLAITALAALCGCASWRFKPTRESRFISFDGDIIRVQYGEERRSVTMPNGAVHTFDGKIHVTLPDGKTATLYQTFSASGVRYESTNKRYVFFEKALQCMIIDNRVAEGSDPIIFRGTIRSQRQLK